MNELIKQTLRVATSRILHVGALLTGAARIIATFVHIRAASHAHSVQHGLTPCVETCLHACLCFCLGFAWKAAPFAALFALTGAVLMVEVPLGAEASVVIRGNSAAPGGVQFAPLLAQVDIKAAAKSFLDFLSIILVLLGVCLVAYGAILIAQGRHLDGAVAIVAGFILVLAVPIIFYFAQLAGVTI